MPDLPVAAARDDETELILEPLPPGATRAAGSRTLTGLRERLLSLIGRLARKQPSEPLVVRGRILSTPDRSTTTIEILVEHGLYWRPARKAILADNAVGVVERGTTRAGEISAGSFVRLELAVARDHVERSGRVEIQNGDVRLVVTLAGLDGRRA